MLRLLGVVQVDENIPARESNEGLYQKVDTTLFG